MPSRGSDREEVPVIPTLRADGKVVVITGASKGLGRAMALGFAEAGADVVVSSRKLDECEKVAAEVRAFARRCLAVRCHVGDWDDCAALIDATVAEFGRIDVLVNNAGIAPVPPSLKDITSDLFDKTIAVNLKGPLRLTALAAEHMPPGSSVINISSKASQRPSPFTVVYAAAKAGQNVLTKAAAQEYGPRGIRVNSIVCGTFHTDSFHQSAPTADVQEVMARSLSLGRIADADEIVGTALYLASDASSYLTGELILLDGGGR
jgi:NAD(P)-dependent dehydrogenase (short-subunit alcohol dehydrogenase family)